MSWIYNSVFCCFLFGIVTILLARASAVQGGLSTAVVYAASSSTIMLIAAYVWRSSLRFELHSTMLTCVAGVLVAVAVFVQLSTFQAWIENTPFIAVIICMNPLIVLAYAIATGSRFTLQQWLATVLALVSAVASILLYSWTKKNAL